MIGNKCGLKPADDCREDQCSHCDQNHEEPNQRIHEEIMGECWHEYKMGFYSEGGEVGLYHCHKCKKTIDIVKYSDSCPEKPDYFSSWDAFGKLFVKCQEHANWREFMFSHIGGGYHAYPGSKYDIGTSYVNPERFATAVCESELFWKN